MRGDDALGGGARFERGGCSEWGDHSCALLPRGGAGQRGDMGGVLLFRGFRCVWMGEPGSPRARVTGLCLGMMTKNDLKLLRQLRAPHGRAKLGLFVAEGMRMCLSLLEAGAVPQKIFVEQRLVALLPAGMPVEVVTPACLQQASGFTTAAGIMGIFSAPPQREFHFEGQFTLALDAIQNPGNLGTLVRAADWFGVRQILCSPDCADLYAPKALQATMGAIANIAVRYEPLLQVLDALPVDFPIVALDMRGESLDSLPPLSQGILLVGNEGRGLSPELLRRASVAVAIPSVGTPAVDSLNAAVAASIVMAHVRR